MSDMIDSGVAMERLRSVTAPPIDRPVLEAAWTDGFEAPVDLSGLIERHAAFAPLADLSELRRVEMINFGGGIAWPCGVDLSAATLRRIAEAQRPMTPAEFRAIQGANNMTNATTARMLGRKPRAIEKYRAGGPIPQLVAIAMRAIKDNPSLLDAVYVAPKRAGRRKREATS